MAETGRVKEIEATEATPGDRTFGSAANPLTPQPSPPVPFPYIGRSKPQQSQRAPVPHPILHKRQSQQKLTEHLGRGVEVEAVDGAANADAEGVKRSTEMSRRDRDNDGRDLEENCSIQTPLRRSKRATKTQAYNFFNEDNEENDPDESSNKQTLAHIDPKPKKATYKYSVAFRTREEGFVLCDLYIKRVGEALENIARYPSGLDMNENLKYWFTI